MEITRQTQDGAATLTLRGRLDAAWSSPVADALQQAVRDGFLDLRLDLAGVNYISSAGIRVLLSQWKDLRRVQGRLSIASFSAEVGRVLQLAGLSALLEVTASVLPSPTRDASLQTWSGQDFTGEIENLAPAARWRGRWVGAANSPLNLAQIAAATLQTVKLPSSTLALGFGALGNNDAECAAQLGELVAAGGAVVYLPANGDNQPDYAVAEGDLIPEARLAQGLVAEGAFAKVARFEVAGVASSVALSDLLAGLLAMADSPQIAFAAVVESAALVGACLRRPPGAPGAEKMFEFPAVRDWLTFTAEPAYQNTVALLVGVATRDSAGNLAAFTRAAGAKGNLRSHVHAAIFPYRPVRHGQMDLAQTLAPLFESRRILGVLHLMGDHRPTQGIGESRFYRGACWFGPMDV
jgi:anti-anti-sigma factor